MKKIGLYAAAALATLSLAACSSNNKTEISNSKATSTSSAKAKVDKFANQVELGNATFNIQNSSGDTTNGDKITILDANDTSVIQIGYSAEKFDGTKLTYIYVDGVKSAKQQFGDNLSQGSVDLISANGDLKKGTHKIEVVQYDTDKEDGTITTFKSQEYTVK